MRLVDLHKWLGKLMEQSPEIANCSIFAATGNELVPDHFHWCDSNGQSVKPAEATEVTVADYGTAVLDVTDDREIDYYDQDDMGNR